MILGSLAALVATSVVLLFAHGSTTFWIFRYCCALGWGRLSRALEPTSCGWLRRGREGEMFGLYATTGRAVSFLAPGLFALFSVSSTLRGWASSGSCSSCWRVCWRCPGSAPAAFAAGRRRVVHGLAWNISAARIVDLIRGNGRDRKRRRLR